MTLLPGLIRTRFYLLRFWAAGIIAAWASAARGAEAFSRPPLRLAVIGDSLSAEYDSLTGIAGVDDPTVYAAITVSGWESMSWVEVLGRLRPGAVDLGGHGTDLLQWGLLRFSGYENNFAVPGFEASHFEQIVNSTIFSHPQYLAYKQQITDGEILRLIGIDPMQPYQDWALANALASSDPGHDPDADRIANLAEFVFGLDPRPPSPPPLTIDPSTTPISARYRPDPDRLRLVEVQPEWSANLHSWAPVPEQCLAFDATGQTVVSFPADASQRFLRLRISQRAVP